MRKICNGLKVKLPLKTMKARTIVEESQVSDCIYSGLIKYPRLEDIWDAWKWRLSRDPETDSVTVDEVSNTMLIKSDQRHSSYGVPTITIMYKYTDDEINILYIKID